MIDLSNNFNLKGKFESNFNFLFFIVDTILTGNQIFDLRSLSSPAFSPVLHMARKVGNWT